jgi:hypothetical protein
MSADANSWSLQFNLKKIVSGMVGQQEILNLEVFRQISLFFLDLGHHQTYLFLL